MWRHPVGGDLISYSSIVLAGIPAISSNAFRDPTLSRIERIRAGVSSVGLSGLIGVSWSANHRRVAPSSGVTSSRDRKRRMPPNCAMAGAAMPMYPIAPAASQPGLVSEPAFQTKRLRRCSWKNCISRFGARSVPFQKNVLYDNGLLLLFYSMQFYCKELHQAESLCRRNDFRAFGLILCRSPSGRWTESEWDDRGGAGALEVPPRRGMRARSDGSLRRVRNRGDG